MPTTALHPRSITEIIDAAFRLLRQHYAQFAVISVVAMLPLIIMRLFVPPLPTLSNISLYFALMAVSFVCTNVAEGATVIAVSDSYLNGRVDVGGALAGTLSRIPAIFGVVVMRALLIVLGCIALIIPGIYIGLRTFAAMPALLLERKSPDAAVGRSWALAGGSVWKVFVALLLAYLIWFALLVVVQLLGTTLIGGRNPQVLAMLMGILSAFIYPIISVVVTLLYYDLRIRREGFDLEIMAKELG